MSGPLVAAILALGLGVIVVRRRSVAIALVAAQSLALGIGALELAEGRSSEYLVASFVLLSKAVVLPALLVTLVRHTPKTRPVVAATGPLVRLAAAAGVALLAVAVPGGLSYVIELGALFDLALVVTVAAAFAHRIHAELGTGDTELLRGLRD